jgi:hypothetical protein
MYHLMVDYSMNITRCSVVARNLLALCQHTDDQA